jgi:hypothetical protein
MFMITHIRLSTVITVITLALGATMLPLTSRASEIEIIVTGTVYSGTDSTGVFGLPPGTDLTGKPYTLTFTFDDTAGTQAFTSTQSYIESTATSNPGTAVLQIGNGSFAFGTTEYYPFAQSEAYKVAVGGNSYALLAGSTAYGSEWDDIQGTIYPAAGTVLSDDPSWEASFTDTNLYVYANENYSLFFGLDEESEDLSASGYLEASTIAVIGVPDASNVPEPGSLWFVVSGCALLTVGSVRRRILRSGQCSLQPNVGLRRRMRKTVRPVV